MNEKKRIFIENLILGMLIIDDETAGFILQDVPNIDAEMRKRLHEPFRSMEVSKSEVLDLLKNLHDTGYVECINTDSKFRYEGRFEDIPTDIENYDLWFQITLVQKRF